LLVLLLVVLQAGAYYPRLPETVASHFDISGEPNGWTSKGAFLGLSVGIALLLAGCFGLLPMILRKLPAAFINVPNRNYWLAPERRPETVERLRAEMLWLGVVAQLLVLVIVELVARANLTARPHLPSPPWWLLAAAGSVTLFWLARVFWMFRVPAETR
jgi:serine/threonine-protein kinase